MLRLVFGFIFLLLGCRLFAQQQYLFTHLGVKDGLASEQTMEAQQDQRGFIWIATSNGLQRYDGYRFLTFHHLPGDAQSIPSDKIFQLHIDGNNRLWMLCQGQNTGYFDLSTFTYHEVPVRIKEGSFKNRYRRIQADNNGNIILVAEKVGVYTYNKAKNEFAEEYNPFQQPANWRVMYVHQDKINNDYWLGCDSGLVKYSVKEKTVSYRGHNTGADQVIKAFEHIKYVAYPHMDKQGRFWIYSWAPTGPGPFVFSHDTRVNKTKNWADNIGKKLSYTYFEVFGIEEQADGTIWVLGENVLARFDTTGNSFQFIERNAADEFSIRYDVIRGMMEDRENNLWVCSNKGVFLFNPSMQLFKTIQNKRPGKEDVYTSDVTDILHAKSGEIVVSTWGNGLFAYDSSLKPVHKPYINESLKKTEGLTWCILQRSNGDIWRGNQDGILFIYHAATGKDERLIHPVFQGATIRQIEEDRDGNLWIGTQGGHLVKWDAASNTFVNKQNLKSVVHRLYKDKKGYLWACTTMQGLFKINTKNGEIEKHYTGDGPKGKRLSEDGAVDIVQYNDSLYMIASYGINILNANTDSILHFNTGNGMPSNETTNIILDKQGILWITAETGLLSFDYEKEILSAYDAAIGIQTNSFHEASINMLRDGRIAIGSVHDFLIFNPADITNRKVALPDVQITGFALSNKWLPLDSILKLQSVELSYDQTSVIIEFSMLTYFSKFGVSYMMEGLDKDWISPGATNQVVYNSLPPGEYTFNVRGENGKGIYSKQVTEFRIRVKAPFWQTWWFYCLLGLIVAVLLFWFDRERISRIRTIFQTRAAIAGNLHDEVNAALSNINVLSEIARMKADHNPEQTKDYITEIHNKSHNMIIAMDDMLWSIDPSNDSMGKMVNRMKEFADALRNRHSVEIDINAEEKIFSLLPDMRLRYELMSIYKQALRLLIEQLKAQHTVVQLEYEKSIFQMTVFSNNISLMENNATIRSMITAMESNAVAINAAFEIHTDEKRTVISIRQRI